ncbi:hypothetical protein FA95DRAFT_1212722 [Auriscalpium vulgare]|uniref:Uncharacterized protein n=1 Tax=Auriscalpium vulgare TaxID=40419 RepID=A0ACB8RUH6_9AGAM|nr:hypothetical protein FA95DRAFT_1212722 [Auriscalpium vulgare]
MRHYRVPYESPQPLAAGHSSSLTGHFSGQSRLHHNLARSSTKRTRNMRAEYMHYGSDPARLCRRQHAPHVKRRRGRGIRDVAAALWGPTLCTTGAHMSRNPTILRCPTPARIPYDLRLCPACPREKTHCGVPLPALLQRM